jgi:hypothetical protein
MIRQASLTRLTRRCLGGSALAILPTAAMASATPPVTVPAPGALGLIAAGGVALGYAVYRNRHK